MNAFTLLDDVLPSYCRIPGTIFAFPAQTPPAQPCCPPLLGKPDRNGSGMLIVVITVAINSRAQMCDRHLSRTNTTPVVFGNVLSNTRSPILVQTVEAQPNGPAS